MEELRFLDISQCNLITSTHYKYLILIYIKYLYGEKEYLSISNKLTNVVSSIFMFGKVIVPQYYVIYRIKDCTHRTLKYWSSPIFGDKTPVNPRAANVLGGSVKRSQKK